MIKYRCDKSRNHQFPSDGGRLTFSYGVEGCDWPDLNCVSFGSAFVFVPEIAWV
jgi:hypothetical protein